jgi:hypothetical protein
MYERTDMCPYTERCKSYQSIIRMERELQNTWLKRMWESPPGVSVGDGGRDQASDVLHKRLDNLMNVKTRCLHFHKRCLKFWQLRAKDAREMEAPAGLASRTRVYE